MENEYIYKKYSSNKRFLKPIKIKLIEENELNCDKIETESELFLKLSNLLTCEKYKNLPKHRKLLILNELNKSIDNIL